MACNHIKISAFVVDFRLSAPKCTGQTLSFDIISFAEFVLSPRYVNWITCEHWPLHKNNLVKRLKYESFSVQWKLTQWTQIEGNSMESNQTK